MTIPHSGPLREVTDLEQAMEVLRSHDLRASTSRRIVLEALFTANRPVSADAIAGGLDGRLTTQDLASVYRNLEVLERLGLVRHLHVGHGPGLYALAGAGEREYLVCDSCHKVLEAGSDEMEAVRSAIRTSFGWTARFTHFPIVGLCPECEGGDHSHAAGTKDHAHVHR